MKKLLIVEDEVSARKAMTEKFTRDGFEVETAANGEEGLTQATKFQPDLILLDIIMPRMDGLTMLQKLRAENEWGKNVPVIILTNMTLDDKEKMKLVGSLGHEEYLIKADWKLADVAIKIKQTLKME